jgi:hypothetical protein
LTRGVNEVCGRLLPGVFDELSDRRSEKQKMKKFMAPVQMTEVWN